MKINTHTKKFKLSCILAIVLVLAVGGIFGSRYYNTGLNYPVITELSKSQCIREPSDGGARCFDLKGKLYKVSNRDTGKIIKYLQTEIKTRHLNGQDNEFAKIANQPTQEIIDKISSSPPEESGGNPYALYIGLVFYGGLFGEYDFPYSTDGKAIVATTYVNPGNESESDSLYALQSDGVTQAQAKLIYRESKKLAADEYLVFIGKNY